MDNDSLSNDGTAVSAQSLGYQQDTRAAAFSDMRYRGSGSGTTTSNSGNSNIRRHHSDNTNNTSNSRGAPKRKKSKKKKRKEKKNKGGKRRKWRWIIGKPRDLTHQQEQVFMTMKLRKLNRALTGTKTKRTRFELFALVAYFVLAFGVVSYSSGQNREVVENEESGSSRRIIVLDLTDIIVMMIYILVVSLVTSVFRESKFITLLYWMFIYLPLAAMIISFMLDDQGDVGGYLNANPVLAVLLVTAEIMVLVGFLALYKLYPKVVTSAWFRRKSRAGIFWRIKVISDWTMTYVGRWGRRFACKYEGETNDQGLPHGFGRWLDDSYSGEVLTGTWINGTPVAPFASRHYGTGDAFKAVRIGYIMASDDDYTTTKFWPTNDKKPRIGLTSVECSISGSFYNELPLATHLSGPHWLDEDQHSVGMLCSQLTHVDDEEERGHQVVQIKASDPRGIQVRGHVYESTGESFNAGLDKIVVLVDKDEGAGEPFDGESSRQTLTPRRSLNFMPRASRQSFRPEKIVLYDQSDDDQSDNDDDDDYSGSGSGDEDSGSSSDNNNINNSNNGVSSGRTGIELTTVMEDDSYPEEPQSEQLREPRQQSPFGRQMSFDLEMPASGSVGAPGPIMRMTNASLRIQDWTPAPHKDALIFFPGYKVPLKQALEALGQFVAMTRLDSRVYPIIFGWPSGQRVTYHAASRLSATQKNQDNLVALIKGLQVAGIRNVHFMTHSMGVQTLLGAFSDNEDGSRSEMSECFQLDPDFLDNDDLLQSSRYSGRSLSDSENNGNGTTSANDYSATSPRPLICRTLTMLNPDFPLESFVDRGFVSVRRVCSTITIIGDRQDKALWGSQFMNGLGVYFGYGQPEVLQPKPTRALGQLKPNRTPGNSATGNVFSEKEVFQGKSRYKQQVIGLSIEELYFGNDVDKDGLNDALLFKDRAPVIVLAEEDDVQDRAWLDVDVIDTTGLDTNIAGIRHSGFNLNPILLKDLEELISTGRRAVNRATLLYREGNNFSYCHAPSYVAM